MSVSNHCLSKFRQNIKNSQGEVQQTNQCKDQMIPTKELLLLPYTIGTSEAETQLQGYQK